MQFKVIGLIYYKYFLAEATVFGYIRVLEGELKINDFGLYRGVYCGLCKTMNKNTGITSPLTLTYDFVLLALVRSGIRGEGFTVRPGKCIAHPIKKRPIAKENVSLQYCAAVSAVLTYYKLLDDKNDKDAKKRLIVRSTLRQAKRNMKKAIKAFPQFELSRLSEKIAFYLSELQQLENSGCDSVNLCADAFGKLLGECFKNGIDDCDVSNNCYKLGYHVGRWIYIIDVADDFTKDKKRSSFNPLLSAGFTELPVTMLKATLSSEVAQAHAALKALPISFRDIYNVLENIICLGMQDVVKKIFEKYENNTQRLEEQK